MKATELFHKYERTFSILLIIVVVLSANMHAVFGLDTLINDDNARYYSFTNDLYKISDPRAFVGLLYALKWIPVYLMSNYSVELARLYILIVYMIPASCLFYYFNREHLSLPAWVSITAAIIVNIIPHQYAIPAFLDGSYPVPGMLAVLSTLIFTSYYLRGSSIIWIHFLLATTSWLLVCDLLAELGIFIYAALIFFIHSYGSSITKKIYLYAATAIITGYRIYFYLQTIGINPTNKPASLSIEDIAGRVARSLEWWMPVKGTTLAVIVTTLIISFTILIALKERNHAGRASTTYRALMLYGAWFIACSLPFWFVSKYFSPRYFYVSYFGLTTLASIVIYQKLILPRLSNSMLSVVFFALITGAYGVQRYLMSEPVFNSMNAKQASIYELLKDENINDNTQIALVNIKNGTGGYHMWGSGYLQYMYKKPGMRGAMWNEINFYDPFNMQQCGYSHRMSCFDIEKELIAYRKDGSNIVKMTYFLQWNSPGSYSSKWTLYKSDMSNMLSIIATGTGLDEYKSKLQDLGVPSDKVLWGNINDEDTVNQLNRNEPE